MSTIFQQSHWLILDSETFLNKTVSDLQRLSTAGTSGDRDSNRVWYAWTVGCARKKKKKKTLDLSNQSTLYNPGPPIVPPHKTNSVPRTITTTAIAIATGRCVVVWYFKIFGIDKQVVHFFVFYNHIFTRATGLFFSSSSLRHKFEGRHSFPTNLWQVDTHKFS